MDELLYNELNKAWKTTCKVLFKEEIGELREYEKWLKEYVKPAVEKKDINGKNVYVFPDEYEKGSRFINFKDINWNKKFEPLNINEIKDIDNIVEALKERFYYAGSIILGKSQFIEKGTSIHESFYVYNSWRVGFSKYVVYSSMIKNSEKIFGTLGAGQSNYNVKNLIGHKSQRQFESYYSTVSSDCYYTANVDDSREALFSFGLQGVSYVIGNRKYERSKYYKIKENLLEQIRYELEKNKRVFSLMEIIEELGEAEKDYGVNELKEEETDLERINRVFNETTKAILKKELGKIDEYKNFLEKHVIKFYERKSPISNEKVYIGGFIVDLFNKEFKIEKRSANLHEVREVGRRYKGREIEKIEMHKEWIKNFIKEFAFISCDMRIGNNLNVTKAVEYSESVDCYYGSAFVHSKGCAYSFWPRDSEHIFGGNMVFNSSFGINVYSSTKVSRAFEVDNVQNSSDVYFSHNVENVIEGMFNFNVKNLSYAIGNVKYARDKYMRIKESLLEQIGDELEKKKDLKWSIYNIGAV